ncbi:hypothetical protein TIFTF001_037815 [Ficus carica]|uniref:RNase H type-1 domain-containing protein n=1 Tax=Ficus carica TaxID=3494 RepID=A0AA88JC86_FICCA|nr:hypothetical protein TIFTF001_037815 [Ficus carica]
MPEGGEHLKVADLMVEGCRVWNKGKIDDTFWPVDQELIRGIPLGNGEGGDKWVWHFDSKGLYKVRSGYRALMDFKRLESSSNANTDITWWRRCGVCHYLPSPDVCVACFPRDKMESISHAILDCPTSQAVWKFSRFWKVVENRRDFPFVDFLRIVKSEIPLEDFALVCWLAWKLWCERNKALRQVPVQSQVVGSDVWLPPQSGYLKLNIDASVSSGSDHIGIGAVIRDEKGRILGAMAKSVEGTFSPFLAECIALREGLMMAKELESFTLVVETDAINVVSAVSDNTEFSLECPILEDVKQLLTQLWNPGVYHIRRSTNHVAHFLARFGFNSNCTNVWICETPILVSNDVSFDAIA